MDLTAGVAGAAARPQLRLPPAGDRDLHQGRRHCAAAAEAEAPLPFMPRALARLRDADGESLRHEAAALRLQKVYKSFRTRRQLADCAVLVEQSWWKLLDFALLNRSSVSFDNEKQETAVSKWSRARSRATKVGKGLSKDDKAQKLALQHWLEAIDPHHRYGHNLHYYYDCWLHSESKQPFFYWLDVEEGKEINLEGKCSRSKLLSQCIKYLGPKEREDYEVVIEDSKFMYRKSRQIIDTSFGPRDAKWIFVLSTSKSLYVGQKKKGKFQHSSFLAGGATSAAGRLVAENGTLKAIWPHSGHYRPTEENFQEFKSFLKDNLVDLTDVKMSPAEEDEEFWGSLKRIASENDKYEDDPIAPEETGPLQKAQLVQTTSTESKNARNQRWQHRVHQKMPKLLKPPLAATCLKMTYKGVSRHRCRARRSLRGSTPRRT
ncbi:IQ domain-containing protein IQM2-like [Hordeum vulgare]|nr:IQ domain-containing protein IQM2-like [Hordeum vulgare]